MKLSKNLLKAMAIGVTLGVATTSCNMHEDAKDVEIVKCLESCDESCQDTHDGTRSSEGDGHDGNCPACGLG